MRKPTGEPPARPLAGGPERLVWMTFAANQITDALLGPDAAAARAKVADLAKRHARALGLGAAHIETAAEQARLRVVQMAEAMNLQVQAHSPARRPLAPPAGQITLAIGEDSLTL